MFSNQNRQEIGGNTEKFQGGRPGSRVLMVVSWTIDDEIHCRFPLPLTSWSRMAHSRNRNRAAVTIIGAGISGEIPLNSILCGLHGLIFEQESVRQSI
jgi:hypothetical protein